MRHCWRQRGLQSELIHNPDHLIPFDRVAVLFLQAFQASADPAFGIDGGYHGAASLVSGAGLCRIKLRYAGRSHRSFGAIRKLVGKLGTSKLLAMENSWRLQWACPIDGPWSRLLKGGGDFGWITLARQLVENTPAFEVFEHAPPLMLRVMSRCLALPFISAPSLQACSWQTMHCRLA